MPKAHNGVRLLATRDMLVSGSLLRRSSGVGGQNPLLQQRRLPLYPATRCHLRVRQAVKMATRAVARLSNMASAKHA
jgi:hypothetical protein